MRRQECALFSSAAAVVTLTTRILRSSQSHKSSLLQRSPFTSARLLIPLHQRLIAAITKPRNPLPHSVYSAWKTINMNTSRLTSTTASAQTHFPGIPVDAQSQEETAKPTLESFPQPAIPAQEELHHRLQQHPYQSSNRRQQQASRSTISTMGSTGAVPKHLNFITGNKNKLAEVRAFFSFPTWQLCLDVGLVFGLLRGRRRSWDGGDRGAA